jgi:hypothetical protein
MTRSHNEDNFATWYKMNQDFLEYNNISEDISRLIFDAGRISAFNHYIQMIADGELIMVEK